MKPELWTIVGVIIGGTLAAGAPLLGEWMRRREESRREVSLARRAAYAQFVALTVGIASTKKSGGTDADHAEELRKLGEATSTVMILASPSTAEVAIELHNAMVKRLKRDFTGDEGPRFRAARRRFVSCARQDLGVSGELPTSEPTEGDR